MAEILQFKPKAAPKPPPVKNVSSLVEEGRRATARYEALFPQISPAMNPIEAMLVALQWYAANGYDEGKRARAALKIFTNSISSPDAPAHFNLNPEPPEAA